MLTRAYTYASPVRAKYYKEQRARGGGSAPESTTPDASSQSKLSPEFLLSSSPSTTTTSLERSFEPTTIMSSPIAIPASNNSRRATSVGRSLPTSAVYVPVHRRGASSASLPEHSTLHSRRSPTPSSMNRYDLLASADIPPASTIPQTHIYSLTALLSLSSSPHARLSPSQHAQVASHLPLMRRASSPSRAAKPKAAESTSPDAPKKAEAPRRRRTGRKQSSAKARLPSAVGADVEGRRRRNAYGAGWGWSAAERVAGQRVDFGRVPQPEESWRAARVLTVTA